MHSLAKLRLSSHKLRIESGRYGESRIERDERYCVFCCKRDVEDEYHFVLVCCLYEELRKKYLKRYFYQKPSVYKYVELMKSKNSKQLLNLSKYVNETFNMRKAALNYID